MDLTLSISDFVKEAIGKERAEQISHYIRKTKTVCMYIITAPLVSERSCTIGTSRMTKIG